MRAVENDVPSLRADEPNPLATGAFVQLTQENARAGAHIWTRQLAAMQAIGMDVVVIQFSASDDRAYYPSQAPGLEPTSADAVRQILDAAEQAGVGVYLGLHMDHSFWTGKFDKATRLARNLAVLAELDQRYGKHAALAGWYVPEEISDLSAAHASCQELLEYFAALAKAARRQTGRPVAISPYFSRDVDPEQYARWWDETALPTIGVDVLAMQDGVGTHRNTVEQARQVFQALAPVAKRHGVKFWANNESFDQTHGSPVDERPWAARPADFPTFLRQMRATSPFVEKTITFEFSHYLDPAGPPEAAKLYQAYRHYYESSRRQPHASFRAAESADPRTK